MVMKKLTTTAVGLAAAFVFCIPTAYAQETTDYTYDALGRLTKVKKTGGPATGVEASYNYDAASNRTNVTVTNSPNGSGGGDTGGGASVPGGNPLFVVVPLNGYTLIPIN